MMEEIKLSKAHRSRLLKLKQKKYRCLERKVLVEGINLIGQLIQNQIFPIEIIVSGDVEYDFVKAASCPVYTAASHEIISLSETETPQPVIAVYSFPQNQISSYRALFYLDNIKDPGNLGTIFRLAAAFGFDGLVLSPDSCEALSPKVIRASLGSVFWLPFEYQPYEWLDNLGAEIIGLSGKAEAKLEELQLSPKQQVIMVIGSESAGISKELAAKLSGTVRIPIKAEIESLNASVAAGIAAYQISRQLLLLT